MILSNQTPLVSVFILCYNQADLIGRAIESVLDQTYKNLQVIVVDDGSTDNSRQVIQSWYDKYPEKMKIFFQPQNVGHPKNMNTGYRLCDGELITYCDGDDWYFPEKVEQEVSFLKNNPGYDVVYSAHDIYSIDGKRIRHWLENERAPMTGDIYLEIFSLDYPMIKYEMTSREILEKEKYYDDRFPIFCDWDLWLRLAQKYKFGYCDYTGSAYVENPVGIVKNTKLEIILRCFQLLLEKNSAQLSQYPEKIRKKVLRSTYKNFDRIQLHMDTWNNKSTLKKTIAYIKKYPEDVFKIKLIGAALLGGENVLRISAFKKMFDGRHN